MVHGRRVLEGRPVARLVVASGGDSGGDSGQRREVMVGHLVDGAQQVNDLIDPGIDNLLCVRLTHDDEAGQQVVLDGGHNLGQALENPAHLGECWGVDGLPHHVTLVLTSYSSGSSSTTPHGVSSLGGGHRDVSRR